MLYEHSLIDGPCCLVANPCDCPAAGLPQIEKAGGLGSTGVDRILDLKPSSIHQRVPTFIGSRETIQELRSYMRRPHPAEEGSLALLRAGTSACA